MAANRTAMATKAILTGCEAAGVLLEHLHWVLARLIPVQEILKGQGGARQ